jgi:hypothetical protein
MEVLRMPKLAVDEEQVVEVGDGEMYISSRRSRKGGRRG